MAGKSASAGRPGGVGNTGQTNRSNITGGGPSSGRPGGQGTQRSVFTSQDGLSKGITVAVGPQLARQNAQRGATYNAAAKEWNDSASKPSIANAVNNWGPMGLSMEPPDLARPSTFSGGDYHLGWNPGSLLGLASPVPGGGVLLGAAGQAAYNAFGGKNLMLGGEGDMGMKTWKDLPGAAPTSPSLTPGGGQLSERTGADIGSFVMPKPTSLNAGNGQLAQAPSFAPNIQPAGSGVKGPTNLAELLQTLQKPTPQSLTQFMGVL